MCTILLIDLDFDIYNLQGGLPCECGLEILQVASVGEGQQVLERRSVDLVVIDYSQESNGLSTISEVTAHDNHPPVIATFSTKGASCINMRKFSQISGASFTFEKTVNKRLFTEACLEHIYDPQDI